MKRCSHPGLVVARTGRNPVARDRTSLPTWHHPSRLTFPTTTSLLERLVKPIGLDEEARKETPWWFVQVESRTASVLHQLSLAGLVRVRSTFLLGRTPSPPPCRHPCSSMQGPCLYGRYTTLVVAPGLQSLIWGLVAFANAFLSALAFPLPSGCCCASCPLAADVS